MIKKEMFQYYIKVCTNRKEFNGKYYGANTELIKLLEHIGLTVTLDLFVYGYTLLERTNNTNLSYISISGIKNIIRFSPPVNKSFIIAKIKCKLEDIKTCNHFSALAIHAELR